VSWGVIDAIALGIKPLRSFWPELPLLNNDYYAFKSPWHGEVVIKKVKQL
jgi:hypothetical protein